MADSTINATIAHCMKSVHDFSVTHVHNICTGAITDVPWGMVDWFAIIGATGIGAGMFLMASSLGIMMWRDS